MGAEGIAQKSAGRFVERRGVERGVGDPSWLVRGKPGGGPSFGRETPGDVGRLVS